VFQVLHSSAGAGKTHALVKHYLRLALATEDHTAYTRILALTFTNKAAGEMRERILLYLEGLAGTGQLSVALTDVRDALVEECGVPAGTIRERTGKMLAHILHHWPQFAVSTIDAFTRRVVMPFARDLRLDSELRMTTEEQDYRDMAVDRLLEEAGSDAPLTELLVAICEDLVESERDWRADKPLRALSTQLTKEQAIAHLEELRDMGNAHFIAIQKRLRTSTGAFREKLRALGRNALDVIDREGLKDEDLYFGKTGPIAYMRALATFDDWLEEKKNTLKALEKDKWASDKASASAKAATERIAPVLRETINTVEDLRGTGELQRHAVTCAVLRDLLPSAALHLLDERLEAIKREEGVTFFSDLVKKVAAIVQREPAPFLYERLGEKYRHFLIDEFQDTSMLQWHALLPLITNALSTGGSTLIVGDAKQAIYRWRNGEARQFARLPRLFGKERMADGDEHEGILERTHRATGPLTENYRSARAIIRFNNDLFDALRDTLPEEHRMVFHEQAQREVKAHEGFVLMECFPPPDKEAEGPDEPPAAPLFTADAVRDAISDGFRPGDIAVLVRTRTQGRAIAEHLVQQGLEVVSPDGLSLGSDAAVNTVMALLTWIHRPDDVSAAHAVQRLSLHDPATVAAFSPHERPSRLVCAWQKDHPDAHARKPLLALLHAIVRALAIDPAQDAFVLGLLNEAHLFTQEHGDSPLTFLDHWERVAAKRSVGGTDNPNAIRVMTVHASKGLQFPVVVVPYADMMARGPRDPVWIDARGVAEDLPAALVRPTKALDGLDIPELKEEDELARLDLVDLLYVAFTRPEHRLYAGFDGGKRSGPGAETRSILQLGPGERKEYGQRAMAPPRKVAHGTGTVTLSPSGYAARAPLVIRMEAPEQWDPADPDPLRSRGRALHAVLARVRVPSDLDRAIDAEADAWGLNADDRTAMRERLEPLLSRPDMRAFFGPDLHVRTETTLIDAQGQAHRPDRIISDGATTRVLDIKTGARSDSHHRQVGLYARLLRELGQPEVSGHLLYVGEGAVVDVDEARMM
jgi:ATP-dependent exoDNAse (exonuclease V) beta subunit